MRFGLLHVALIPIALAVTFRAKIHNLEQNFSRAQTILCTSPRWDVSTLVVDHFSANPWSFH